MSNSENPSVGSIQRAIAAMLALGTGIQPGRRKPKMFKPKSFQRRKTKKGAKHVVNPAGTKLAKRARAGSLR